MGKAIPPPKDRLPSGGNYKEMPEGVQEQPANGHEQSYEQQQEAQEYVQDLMDKASASAGQEEEEEEEAYWKGGAMMVKWKNI